MPTSFKTPGVYVEEIPTLPVSVIAVATAIPAFIGYTQKAEKDIPGDLDFMPTPISSLPEYEQYFGTTDDEIITINISDELTQHGGIIGVDSRDIKAVINTSKNIMYYQMQIFFANGGGDSCIISTGRLKSGVSKTDLRKGLDILHNYNGATLIVFPEGVNLTRAEDLYDLYNEALTQAYNLKDRFVIMDVSKNVSPGENETDLFRETITGGSIPASLKYGAVYYPMLVTNIPYRYEDPSVTIVHTTVTKTNGENDVNSTGGFNKLPLSDILLKNNIVYAAIKTEIATYTLTLPPSAAVAGIYTTVDDNQGVWKSPANISLTNVTAPSVLINDQDQEGLNIDVSGKSIDAIRNFPGKGTLVWGARTLAGNSNDWRYISVCRLFMMIENSIQNVLNPFVFAPNDTNTWTTVKSIINNFLLLQWKQGALQGAKPEEAYFVQVGLGETMTEQDILDGKMIIEIGMAPVRPAEFIIVSMTQQIQVN